jgi:hypothetical protein
MRKHMLKWASLLSVALAVAFFAPQRAAADGDDPPSRVARLSYAQGSVSFNPGGTDDWVSAVVNRPITTGDKLWTDNGARAELHIGSAAIRLSSNTGFSFLNLDDRMAQIRLTEGTLDVRVRRLDQDETFEIDTPNLAFSILRPGNYKINVNEAGDTTFVTVRDGEGEVTGGGSAYTIHARETGTFAGTDQLDADIQRFGNDNDDFDRWSRDRDRREDRSQSSRYVSSDVIGYEDLDDNGGWRPVPEYGTVWFPHTTIVGWAPYRYGHWVWISPWGWTWVDDAPWGFAPFHYGRWVTVGGVWGWVPCPPRREMDVEYVRPVYAPALVAWVGGPHFSVGIGIGGGGGGGVAWFPLGPREVYEPSYHVSRTYVTNVNVSNTTVNNTVVNNYYNNVIVNKNVTNVTYVNQTAPNGVTATSQQNFSSAQPIGRNMIKVDRREVESARVNATTPTVAPQQKSVLGAGATGAARPPERLQEREVVAKTPPPPAPVSFVKQQQEIRANGGRPPAVSQMRQAQAENTQQARPNIKIAPSAQPGMPQNVQTNRPGPVQYNNGNRPGQPQSNVQNNSSRPPAPNNEGQRQSNEQNNSSKPPAYNNAGQPQSNVQNNSNRPPVPNNSGQPPANVQSNSNRPPASNNPGQQPQGNQQGNSPASNGREKSYNDRPSNARPISANPTPPVNPQLDQKHQQQLDQLRLKQDQERQKVEQKQIQEQQRIQQKSAADARRQQVDQRQQQQPQQIDQRQVQQQQQRAQQTNAEDARRQQVDQRQQQPQQTDQRQIQQQQRTQQTNAADARRQQVDQRQQQVDQRQQQQLQQLEQKHGQEQQKLEQRQQQERQKQQEPPKDKQSSKPPKG